MKKIFIFLNIIISITFLSSCYADDMHIKFAMEATYPPFESIDTDGNIIGFDIDIANNICKKINAKCSFINAPWDSLIPGLKLGKFNAIISALAITSERAKQVAFSQAYYFDTASFVGSKINPIETTSAGLLGKSIGVQGGTAMENYMRGFYSDKKINVKAYPRIMDAF